MFDTPITVVGNVLTPPEWRRTRNTNTLVLNFKVASTARRFDKDGGQWVDGPNLRVRVTCWRRLAENVAASVMLGDPVVVHGRIYTREWTDEDGARHLAYELEALSVGHDLSRGVAKFARRRSLVTTDMVDGSGTDSGLGGEPADPVPGPGPVDQTAGPARAAEPDGDPTDPAPVPSGPDDEPSGPGEDLDDFDGAVLREPVGASA